MSGLTVKLREHYQQGNAQTNQHFELYRMSRTQVNEAYLNGPGSQYPPYQSEAVENVQYWYDGNVPYYTDAAAWQPLDDTFLHMNVPGYSYVDKLHGPAHQLVAVHHPHVDVQESLQSYTLQFWEQPSLNAHNRTPTISSPTSPCTSLSSLPWSDSEPSPSLRRHHLDDATIGLPSALPFPPSLPQTASPACAQQQQQQPLEAPGPRRPSLAPPSPNPTSRDTVGRRAPKQRRITRAVQPLACYFCRGRKIACGPPANLGPVLDAALFVSIPQSHTVAAAPLGLGQSRHL
ncbi:hypothetical protein BJV74DRAFT_885342 [Russula compacta]|nr:hypothetical protein BJV74DRAFT_885342 [Russula compacta]